MTARSPVPGQNAADTILLALTTVAALALVPIWSVTTGPDSAFYLEKALDIYLGHGYEHATRGPVFVTLLSAAFHVADPSVFSAMLLMRLFYVLNFLLACALAWRLAGIPAATATGAIVLSCGFFHHATATVTLDPVYPFFLLLGLWLSHEAFENRRKRWHLAAGLCIGIAVLTKELALLHALVPLAYFLLVAAYRRSAEGRAGIVLQFGAMFVTVLPWLLYLALELDALNKFFGQGGPKNVSKLSASDGETLWQAAQFYLSGLPGFAKRYVTTPFVIWPLWVISWLYIFFRSKDIAAFRLLALIPVMFLPVMIAEGHVFIRLGQNYLVYIVSCIVCGVLIGHSLGAVRRTSWRAAGTVVLYLMLFVACALQFDAGRQSAARVLTGNSLALKLLKDGRFPQWREQGTMNHAAQKVGQWMLENLTPGEAVVAGYTLFRPLYFYTEGRYPIFRLPYDGLDVQLGPEPTATFKSGANHGALLFVWSHARRDRFCNYQSVPCIYLRTFYEGNFLDLLRQSGAQTVVLEPRTWFMHRYLDRLPGTTLASQVDRHIRIYSITRAEPIDGFNTQFGEEVPRLLAKVQESLPSKMDFLMSTVFEQRLGLLLSSGELVNGAAGIELYPKTAPAPE